jgi:hypothetical protein
LVVVLELVFVPVFVPAFGAAGFLLDLGAVLPGISSPLLGQQPKLLTNRFIGFYF